MEILMSISPKDPGKLAHNAKYVIQLMYDSIADLNTKLASSSTITLNVPITVGTLNFNNTAASYTLGGANALTLLNNGSKATVLVWAR
jgi:hypothetical protein